MPSDPYYRTPAWRALRTARLRFDNGMCTAPGCGKRAVVVDHVRARRGGGADHLANLRSLCDLHDRQVKELPNGKRRNGGVFRDVDASGQPIDANHPWNAGGRSIITTSMGQDRQGHRILSKFLGGKKWA